MEKEKLEIVLVQFDIEWEAPQKNQQTIEAYLKAVDSADIIVLPEMFSTGFIQNPKQFAETMLGNTIQWMKSLANEKQAVVCGSLVIEEKGSYYNRFLFVKPDQSVEYYDKKHLFSFGGEGKNFSAGSEQKLFNYSGWKIAPFICYDLRFPVWSRNAQDYDLAIYVANWPKPRAIAWETLLRARSIENQTYVIGVNRVGVDVNKFEYIGGSNVYDPLGKQLLEATETVQIFRTTIDKNHLMEIRTQVPFLRDRDNFEFK